MSFKGPMMWYHPFRMERHNWGPTQWSLAELDNRPKQTNDFLWGHPTLCLFNNGDLLHMLPMLAIKKRLSTIKQLGKRDNARKKPLTLHKYLKITLLRNVIKSIFLRQHTSRPNQGVGQRRFECQKRWPHNLQGLMLQIDGGISAPEMPLNL